MILAVVALFAFILALEAVEFIDTIWPVVAMVIPFVVARITDAEAARWFKVAVAVVLSLVAGGVTALGMDWSNGFETMELVERLAAIFGVVHATYLTVDMAIQKLTDNRADLNTIGPVKPDSGLGG